MTFPEDQPGDSLEVGLWDNGVILVVGHSERVFPVRWLVQLRPLEALALARRLIVGVLIYRFSNQSTLVLDAKSRQAQAARHGLD